MAQYEPVDPANPDRVARLGGKNSQPRPFGRGLFDEKRKPLTAMGIPPTEKTGGMVQPTSGLFPPSVTGL